MMNKGIVMPAHFVDDGKHDSANKGGNLFHVGACTPCHSSVCLQLCN